MKQRLSQPAEHIRRKNNDPTKKCNKSSGFRFRESISNIIIYHFATRRRKIERIIIINRQLPKKRTIAKSARGLIDY
jgi:hypothetical protein